MSRSPRWLVVTTTVLLSAACGLFERELSPEVVRWCEEEPNKRLLEGTRAGMEEAQRRGLEVDEPLPEDPYLPDGTLHPLVERFAMDGDGRLRGEGLSMTTILQNCEQAIAYSQ